MAQPALTYEGVMALSDDTLARAKRKRLCDFTKQTIIRNKDTKSVKDITQMLAVSKRSVQRVLREDAAAQELTPTRPWEPQEPPKKKGRPLKGDPLVASVFLHEACRADGARTQEGFAQDLKEDGVDISRFGIRRLMKAHIITRKRAKKRSVRTAPSLRN